MAEPTPGRERPSILADFDVIVLAAGASSRFPNGNKLVHPYQGRPLISHLFETIAELDLRQRIVVTGAPYRSEIRTVLAGYPGWQECFNSHASSGMGSSIAVGAALLDGSRGVFICPGDMPAIGAGDFLAVARLFTGPQSICRPTFGGRPGHPVLIGHAHYERLRRLEESQGAASLINDVPHCLSTYASTHAGVALDCDLPEHFL